ncbi:MAG: hypothetical protein KJO47_08330 [Gammaproteobacteria bacterium]|nr:hypothetical protein [Gammaproteobacteria bacterium]
MLLRNLFFFYISGLQKRIPSRSRIPGYVEITVRSPDESILTTVTTSYRRKTRKSTICIFSVDIPLLEPEGNTIRAIHHRKRLI